MTLPAAMEVEVFKPERRPDTFLFLPEGLPPGEWPDGLEEVFMPAEKVLSLTLTAEKELIKEIETLKMKKGELVQVIVFFETDIDNIEKVTRRKKLWGYLQELKSDPYFNKYVIFDI